MLPVPRLNVGKCHIMLRAVLHASLSPVPHPPSSVSPSMYSPSSISCPKITAEYIFASLATLSEFVVFLYMGMGVFTGRFHEWDWCFIALAITFCLVARVFNTFPFSALANLW